MPALPRVVFIYLYLPTGQAMAAVRGRLLQYTSTVVELVRTAVLYSSGRPSPSLPRASGLVPLIFYLFTKQKGRPRASVF
jgi:hypothetical protein